MLPKKLPKPYPIFSRTRIPPSKNFSASGIRSIRLAIVTNTPAVRANTPINFAAPIAAPGATTPTLLNIKHAPDIDSNIADKAAAFTIVDLADRFPIKYRIPAKLAITANITPMPIRALVAICPAFPIKIIVPDIANIRIDSEATAPSASLIGSCAIITITPVSTPIATVNTISEPIALDAAPATFIIPVNINIKIPSAPTAPVNLEGSINDSATTAAAITPIATVIAIKLPLQSFAFAVALIISDIIKDRTPIAIIPGIISLNLIKLSNNAMPARIPIASDIASNVAAIFGASLPANLLIAVSSRIINPNAAMTACPFTISLIGISANIFIVKAIIAIAIAIFINTPPKSPYTNPLFLVIAASNARIPVNPNIANSPFAIAATSILPSLFMTSVSINIAMEILISVPPNASIFFPAIRVNAISVVIIMESPVIAKNP